MVSVDPRVVAEGEDNDDAKRYDIQYSWIDSNKNYTIQTFVFECACLFSRRRLSRRLLAPGSVCLRRW